LARDGFAAVAFAIDVDWRRRGIGSREAATRWAEQAGVTTLRMVISRNNWPLRQLAHKAGPSTGAFDPVRPLAGFGTLILRVVALRRSVRPSYTLTDMERIGPGQVRARYVDVR
jgi:hypothetical protein